MCFFFSFTEWVNRQCSGWMTNVCSARTVHPSLMTSTIGAEQERGALINFTQTGWALATGNQHACNSKSTQMTVHTPQQCPCTGDITSYLYRHVSVGDRQSFSRCVNTAGIVYIVWFVLLLEDLGCLLAGCPTDLFNHLLLSYLPWSYLLSGMEMCTGVFVFAKSIPKRVQANCGL